MKKVKRRGWKGAPFTEKKSVFWFGFKPSNMLRDKLVHPKNKTLRHKQRIVEYRV